MSDPGGVRTDVARAQWHGVGCRPHAHRQKGGHPLMTTDNERSTTPDAQTRADAERNRRHRVLIAQIAAAERWGRVTNRAAATAPARTGLRAKFEREADPGGSLVPTNEPAGPTCLCAPTCSVWPAGLLKLANAA